MSDTSYITSYLPHSNPRIRTTTLLCTTYHDMCDRLGQRMTVTHLFEAVDDHEYRRCVRGRGVYPGVRTARSEAVCSFVKMRKSVILTRCRAGKYDTY